jgi:hypothetical protein
MGKYLDSLRLALASFFEFTGDIYEQCFEDVTTYVVEDLISLYEYFFVPEVPDEDEDEALYVFDLSEPSSGFEISMGVTLIDDSKLRNNDNDVTPVINVSKDDVPESVLKSGELHEVNTEAPINWSEIDHETWNRDWFKLESTEALLVRVPDKDKTWVMTLDFYSKVYKAVSLRAGDQDLPINDAHRSLFAVRLQIEHNGKKYDKVIYQPYCYFLKQKKQFQLAAPTRSDVEFKQGQILYGCIGMFTVYQHMPFIYTDLGFGDMSSIIHVPSGKETTYLHSVGMI